MNEQENNRPAVEKNPWQGHGFGDYCEWSESDFYKQGYLEIVREVVRSKVVLADAQEKIFDYINEDSRGALRVFDVPETKFSAWDYLPHTIVKVNLNRISSPLGSAEIEKEQGSYLGVTIRINPKEEADPVLKIALAKEITLGKKKKIEFEIIDPIINLGVVDHKKVRYPRRRADIYDTFQDILRIDEVHLLKLGKRSEPPSGKRARSKNPFGFFAKGEKSV